MPDVLWIAIALGAGLLTGSFLNACIYRLPRDLSVVRPARSFCPSCEATIAWYDNIPLLSFLFLRGRCRACRASISWRYPLVEALTAAAFLASLWQFGPGLEAARLAVYSALLIGLIFTDFEERILPDEFTLGGAFLGIAFAWFVLLEPGFTLLLLPEGTAPRWQSAGESLLGALGPSFSLWAVGELYFRIRGREGLGFGDVKMTAMMGAFLGLAGVLPALILGSVLGSVAGVLFILARRKDAATYELPFGSFLGLASLLLEHVLRPWLRSLPAAGAL
jgi:leader peptidase (prepilin peptidase)/N-methyltransferase